MLQNLAELVHLSPLLLYLLAIAALALIAFWTGLVLNRALHRAAKKASSSRRELALSLVAPLPVPLLILAALYAGLEVLGLPGRYERLGSHIVSVLAVVVLFFFPSKVIVMFLRRLGERRQDLARWTEFASFITRTFFVLLTTYTVLETLKLPPGYERLSSKLAAAVGVVLGFLALAKAVDFYLSRLTERDPTLERVTEPVSFVARVLFALLATVVVLENLGVHLTAVWTTLGVGSVAIALALQETLGNLFSGLYLLADRPIRPGDYIKLDSGQEGYVVHVGWRATSIRALASNIVVVPNLSMCKAVITNYSRPDERTGLGIQISVARGTDPRRVERILVEVGREAARESKNGLLAEPEPSASFIPGFGSSTFDFTLGFQVRRFIDQYGVQSELRKRIWERFQQEGIEIVGPAQALILDQSVLRLLQETEGDAAQMPRTEAQPPKVPVGSH